MGTTTVINKSHCVIEIEEGNAGVWSKIATVEPNKSYRLTLNPNATYREYLLFHVVVNPLGSTPPTRKKVTLTSDDFLGISEIEILVHPETEEFIMKKVEKTRSQGLTDGHLIDFVKWGTRVIRGIFGQVHSWSAVHLYFRNALLHALRRVEVFRSLSRHTDRCQDDHVHADIYFLSFCML